MIRIRCPKCGERYPAGRDHECPVTEKRDRARLSQEIRDMPDVRQADGEVVGGAPAREPGTQEGDIMQTATEILDDRARDERRRNEALHFAQRWCPEELPPADLIAVARVFDAFLRDG